MDGVGIAALVAVFLRHGYDRVDVQFVALDLAAQFADAVRRAAERHHGLAGAADFQAVMVGVVLRQADLHREGDVVEDFLIAAAGVEPHQQGQTQGDQGGEDAIDHGHLDSGEPPAVSRRGGFKSAVEPNRPVTPPLADE